MIHLVKKSLSNFLHLFYPHNCEGCGTDILFDKQFLCAKCVHDLPKTVFFAHQTNPIEKLFYGRLNLHAAGSLYYFTKDALVQHLLVQLKYKGNKECGYFLGRMMGHSLLESNRFTDIDLLLPLPLHAKKEHIRGYNQATLLCEGIQEVLQKPIVTDAVSRIRFTETQTQQNRVSRWQNMEGIFAVTQPDLLTNKHILLVDDVITTGATLEACGAAILEIEGVLLSIASAAYTS